jgi:hypothetical protein
MDQAIIAGNKWTKFEFYRKYVNILQ